MLTEFKLPELGENIESGTVVKVLVSAGDKVAKDQPLLELETDKAVVEVPSPAAGVIRDIRVQEGAEVKVGQVLVTLDTAAAAGAPAAPPAAEPAAPAVAAAPAPDPQPEPAPAPAENTEVRLPELGENIESGTVVKVLVSVGETVAKDQPLLELETDKAVVEVPSPVAGVVKKVHVHDGAEIKVGQAILTVAATAPAAARPAPQPAAQPAAPTQPAPPSDGRAAARVEAAVAAPAPARPADGPRRLAPAAPSVRRLARELGVDINRVPGAGPGGRISPEDVKNYVRQQNLAAARAEPAAAPPAPVAGVTVQAAPLPDFSKWGQVEREPMSNVRRVTAERLSQAWATIPHVTQFEKADITDLEKLRKQFARNAEAAGGKLTITAILLKVVAAALKVFPKFNASIDLANREIVYKRYFHLGVAVDTDRGLLVPVIRDVDQKNIIELAVELNEVSQKARDRKLTLEDMQGASFTISNLGGIGGAYFTPIVNPPEVAILGVSRGHIEPVYRDGQFEPRLMLPLSLSYDHRLIDGADAARFARWLAAALEQPFLLSLEG